MLSGEDFLLTLESIFGDYRSPDIKNVIPLYTRFNGDSLRNVGRMYCDMSLLDPFKTYDLHSSGTSDIAPPTVDTTITTPSETRTLSKAPMDSDTVHKETEETTTVNGSLPFTASSVSTSYDKTDVLHNTVTNTQTSGNVNIKLSDILQGQIDVQYRQVIFDYISLFIGRFCHRVWSDSDDD